MAASLVGGYWFQTEDTSEKREPLQAWHIRRNRSGIDSRGRRAYRLAQRSADSEQSGPEVSENEEGVIVGGGLAVRLDFSQPGNVPNPGFSDGAARAFASGPTERGESL